MDVSIAHKTIEVERLIGERDAQALVHAETMVPGAGREAVEPLMEEATLTIGQTEVQHDRVVLDGIVSCQAIYRQGDETAVRALTANATLNQVLDMPGVAPGMILKVTGQVEHAEAVYENGHMIFKVVVGLHAQVRKLDSVALIEGISGVPGLQTQTSEVSSSKLSAESGAELVLREQVSLPTELDARMALMDFASARVKDVVPDLGGVKVSGEVLTETLIGTGVPGRPVAKVMVALPFEQLVDLPEWLTDRVTATANVRRMATQVQEGTEGQEGTLGIECDLQLRVGATGKDSIQVISDAYATGENGLELTQTTLNTSGGEQLIASTEPFKGTLLLPESTGGVGLVLAVRARPTLSEWSAAHGHTTLDGVMECKVLYLPAGSEQVSSIREEVPFSLRIQGELPPEAWVSISASGAEAGAQMADRIEIRCQMRVEGTFQNDAAATVLTEVQDAGPQQKQEGIILAWPGEADDLWTLGKKYRVPAQMIADLNGIKDKVTPGKAILLRM